MVNDLIIDWIIGGIKKLMLVYWVQNKILVCFHYLWFSYVLFDLTISGFVFCHVNAGSYICSLVSAWLSLLLRAVDVLGL